MVERRQEEQREERGKEEVEKRERESEQEREKLEMGEERKETALERLMDGRSHRWEDRRRLEREGTRLRKCWKDMRKRRKNWNRKGGLKRNQRNGKTGRDWKDKGMRLWRLFGGVKEEKRCEMLKGREW